MAQYLSEDRRIRVIGAVEGGMSRNGAAKRFGVSLANVVCWRDEYLRCGRTAPKPRSVRGESFAISTFHAFYCRHGVRFTKDCPR